MTTHQEKAAREKAAQEQKEQEDAAKQRRDDALEVANEREKDNNPGTADQRTYAGDAPGLHPANQPAPEQRAKGTRVDLEDLTGNPGHRGVNPHAPAGSMNRTTDPATGDLGSINEPPGSEPIPPGLDGEAEAARKAIGGQPPGEAPKPPAPSDENDDDDTKTRRKR